MVNRRWAASTCIQQEGRGYSEVEGGGDWEVGLCDLCGGGSLKELLELLDCLRLETLNMEINMVILVTATSATKYFT